MKVAQTKRVLKTPQYQNTHARARENTQKIHGGRRLGKNIIQSIVISFIRNKALNVELEESLEWNDYVYVQRY